ncbi:hypothetical protein FALBO_6694 [Fusarium albosuccineum]|uniref:Uncharacterized protein n=1 Tax=Fusarium albosuccineum TaxID=1237068 RepID=A0A8H4LEY6_9HYPO|nr:hypothetical protein FALBO_6694 [Fusarium albosuccineum]
MAFHQPTRQSIQRVVRPPVDEQELPRREAPITQERQQEESQTWVLFALTDVTTTSYLTETDQSLLTPGRSRVGDLGSLNSAVKSEAGANSRLSAAASAVEDEDDAELDSLDSHLPEFRSLPGIYSPPQDTNQGSLPVFPGHDGLGSFHLDQPTLGADAQEQIYQFERFNPRRQHRRKESFDLRQLDVEHHEVQESEKRQRIEAWRLEHSRVLLGEIQRETRRRRLSQASLHKRSPSNPIPVASHPALDTESDNMTWHDEDAMGSPSESEGFLTKITRRFMRDVIGLDDRMISIFLGEATPEDGEDLSSTPRASQQLGVQPPQSMSREAWQLDILEKMSRDLGMLVSQISHHPGAFSTYTRVQQMPLPYAGLPIIPESNTSHSAAENIQPADPDHASFPQFKPTMQAASRPIDIRGRSSEPPADPVQAPQQDTPMGNTFTQEEWERDLDMKLVFRYLRSRFMPRNSNPPPSTAAHLATSSNQDIAAKLARVRQHHPLVSRMRPPAERRTFKATTPTSPVALRHPSSCASQSTRRSARRSSVSSRHYWDIGGSLGTGSVIASNGPMGSWGEV